MSVTVERSFHLADVGGARGGVRRSLRLGADPTAAQPAAAPVGRVPRIARLMALAIRCEELLRSKTIADASALARLAHVTQPRMTQILNLTLLAPDIQERLLWCADGAGIHEKHLRQLCAITEWERQRAVFDQVSRDGDGAGPLLR